MYASAMKFCGAMELCGIGWPRGEPFDHAWPEVEAQVAAQKAGLLVAICRERVPEEADLMKSKGFVPVYRFTNPRTGNVGVLYIKDMTSSGGPVTKLPETVPWGGGPPRPVPQEVMTARLSTRNYGFNQEDFPASSKAFRWTMAMPTEVVDDAAQREYIRGVASNSALEAIDVPF